MGGLLVALMILSIVTLWLCGIGTLWYMAWAVVFKWRNDGPLRFVPAAMAFCLGLILLLIPAISAAGSWAQR